jgi:hypothetical protein
MRVTRKKDSPERPGTSSPPMRPRTSAADVDHLSCCALSRTCALRCEGFA